MSFLFLLFMLNIAAGAVRLANGDTRGIVFFAYAVLMLIAMGILIFRGPRSRNRNSGFTAYELLVVTAIIGVLSMFAIRTLRSSNKYVRRTTRAAWVNNLVSSGDNADMKVIRVSDDSLLGMKRVELWRKPEGGIKHLHFSAIIKDAQILAKGDRVAVDCIEWFSGEQRVSSIFIVR